MPRSDEKLQRPEAGVPADAERAVEQVTRAVDEVMREGAAFIEQSRNEPGAEEAVAEMQEVLRQADVLEETTMQRIERILRMPAAAWKRYSDRREEAALAVVDNPKIIMRLQRMLANDAVDVRTCVALYERATREYERSWSTVHQLLDKRLVPAVVQAAGAGDLATAVSLYDHLSQNVRSHRYQSILTAIVQPLAAVLPTDSATPAGARARIVAYRRWNDGVRAVIGDRSALLYSVNHYLQYTSEPVLFSDTERFLLRQPEQQVERLAQIPEDDGITILEHWKREPNGMWSTVLQDEAYATLADVMCSLPTVRHFVPHERTAVLQIAEQFDRPTRAQYASELSRQAAQSWETVYGCLVLRTRIGATREQLDALPHHALATLTTVMHAYGEERMRAEWTEQNVADFTELETETHRYESSSFSDYAFARDMSSTVRGHLPQKAGSGYEHTSRVDGRKISTNAGFQGLTQCLVAFERMIDLVPPTHRDRLFAVLRPEEYGWDRYRENQPLTETEIEHFLEYDGLMVGSASTFSNVMHTRDYFSAERWPAVRQGIDLYTDIGMLPQTTRSTGWLEIFAHATDLECQPVHHFLQHAAAQSAVYVSRGDSRCHTPTRTAESVANLYTCHALCEKYFRTDTQFMMNVAGLTEPQQIIVQRWLDGTLTTEEFAYEDTPLIEGELIRLSHHLRHASYDNSRWLEVLCTLSTQQKHSFLFLANKLTLPDHENADEQFAALARGSDAAAIVAFVDEMGFERVPISCVRKMMQHPECRGLFFYIRTDRISPDRIEAAIDQFVALRAAGLSTAFDLSAPDASSAIMEYTDGSQGNLNTFLAWNPQKLVAIANSIAERNFGVSFVRILHLPHEESLEELERRVAFAHVQNSKYIPGYGDVPEAAKVAEAEDRMRVVRALDGVAIDNTVSSKVLNLSSVAWGHLHQRPEVLRLFLTGGSWSCPDAVTTIPDSLLTQPELWAHTFPGELWKDPTRLQRAVDVANRLSTAGVQLPHSSEAPSLVQIAHAFAVSPWLFDPDGLAVLRIIGIAWVEPCAQLTHEQWQRIQPWLNEYKLHLSEAEEFFSSIESGVTILPDVQRDELAEAIGRPIPLDLAKEIGKRLSGGESLTDIIHQYDSGDDWTWKRLREETLQRRVAVHAPHLAVRAHSSVKSLLAIEAIPTASLQRMDAFVDGDGYYSQLGGETAEDALNRLRQIAEHPNSEVVLSFEQAHNGLIFYLLQETPERVEQFCSRLTPRMIEDYRALPEYLYLKKTDVVDFFLDPAAPHVAESAAEFKELYGGDFRTSAYSVLLTDPNVDIHELRAAAAGSLLPLTLEQMQGLSVVSSGSRLAALQRGRGFLGEHHAVPFRDALPLLSGLSHELAMDVVRESGRHAFGWDIAEHRAECAELGFGVDDFKQLLNVLYAGSKDRWENIPVAAHNEPLFWAVVLEDDPLVFQKKYRALPATCIPTESVACAVGYFDRTSLYDAAVFKQYRELFVGDGAAAADTYIGGLRDHAKGLIGPELPLAQREQSEYRYMVKLVFPDGNYSNYEINLACGDRLEHVNGYQFKREGYPVVLTGLLGYQLQTGAQDDLDLYKSYERRLSGIRAFIASRGPDNASLQKTFQEKVDGLFAQHAHEQFRDLEGLNAKEKMLVLFISEATRKAGTKTHRPNASILDLVVEYKYAFHENLEAYVQRSAHDVTQYKEEVSQRFVLWSELATIYGENVKHVLRHNIFEDLAQSGGHYAAIVERFGAIVGATREEPALSAKQVIRVRATFENERIPAERKLHVLKGQVLNMFGTNLVFESGEQRDAFNEEVNGIVDRIRDTLDEDHFMAVVPELFAVRNRYRFGINAKLEELFTLDYNALTREIAKFEERIETEDKETRMGGAKDKHVKKSAKKRRIRGHFTKTQETANARMGAYLCIAGDQGMWRNENYFEFVVQDEDTGRCVGLAMLLRIEAGDGKRYLWFGPNPFESFLTQVSAEKAFDHQYDSVAEFAAANGFDGVVVPGDEGQILGGCTNRGGTFPDLIKAKRLRDRKGNLRVVDFGQRHQLGGGYGYTSGALIWERAQQ